MRRSHSSGFQRLSSRDCAFALPILLLFLVAASSAEAADYYVSTTGNDSNPGTMAQPFATLQRGASVAVAGDTVYVRGGVYMVATSSATAISLSRSGTSDTNRIRYWAYQNEKPVLDFSQVPAASGGTTAVSVSGSWLHLKGFEIRNVRMATRSSTGVGVTGHDDVFEMLDIHDIAGSGLFIHGGDANNGGHLVLNCDSHDNYDPNSDQGDGQNADGFGVHYQLGGPSTTIRGCRAWNNSDDGYDYISQEVPVITEWSFAMSNGRGADGNGNGFKIGSSKNGIRHIVRNNVAWKNKAAGFYANHSSCGNTWLNNTSYMNGTQYNMLASTWDAAGNRTDGVVLTGDKVHRMRNNIGFPNKNSNMTGVETAFNTWDLGIVETAGAFESTSDAGCTGPREADGSIPSTCAFMRLRAGSPLIDKGTDVGLPFVGGAPDLGAFEFGAVTTTGSGGAGGSGTGGSGAGGAVGTAGTGGGGGGAAAGRGGAAGGGAGRGGSSGSGGLAGVGGSGGAGAAAGAGGSSGANGVAGIGGGAAGIGGMAGASGPGGSSGTGGPTTGVAGATGAGATGGGAAGGGGTTAPPDDPAPSGCACAIDANAGDGSVASVLSLLALGLVVARRGRARSKSRPLVAVAALALGVVGLSGCAPTAPGNVTDGGPGGGSAGSAGVAGAAGSTVGSGGAAGDAGSAGTAGTAGSAGTLGTTGGAGADGGGGGAGSGGAVGGTTGSGGGGGSTAGRGGSAAGGGGRGGLAGTGTAGASAAGSGGAGGSGGRGGSAQAGSGGTASSDAVIINDRFWRDTSGTPIYSQGGGVLQVGATFYWYGVKYGGAVTYAANPAGGKIDDTSFQGVTIYSSTNLVDWKLENTVRPANTGGWFGRLGVVYHAGTKKYVLVAQGGGGLYFATSDTPNGTFTYNNVQTNLPGIVNGATGDQTTFQDDDGQAYLISSSSSGRANRYVSPLRASDFLAVENAVLVYRGDGREGNCLFKHDGTYTFCSSDLHGWNSSQSYCVSASNIRGPYGPEFVMQGTSADFSHVTQTGFFISVKGSVQNTIIFAGDRWSDFAGNGLGYNQWMPLTFTGSTPRMESLSHWSINVATGTWSVDARNNYALNPSFEADRVAMTQPAGWTTSNGTNVQTPHTGRWSWQLAGTSSLNQAIANLPNGAYTLSVWVRASGAGAQVYARGFGGTDRTTSIAAATAWTNLTLTGITVSNGRCEVGVSTTGQTVTVDDFVLSRG